jgi:hypothetical protein
MFLALFMIFCLIMTGEAQMAKVTFSPQATQQINAWANKGSPSTSYVARELATNGRSSSTPGK